jgi:hypothetical protein|tara:strand:+ start:1753 stop:2226 length:474 start_codon:yes stop_codon:yes gene_type:complete
MPPMLLGSALEMHMKLREFITAEQRPVGQAEMHSKAKVYVCELGPYWRDIKQNVVDAESDITVDAFKEYWLQRYKAGEVEYSNILWANQSDFVTRNIFRDETGEYFIRLQHGWAPVISSFSLGTLVRFMDPESHPKLSDECGLVYVYPWATDYGRRL